MTVLNTTSPVAGCRSGKSASASNPRTSPSNKEPSAKASSPSRHALSCLVGATVIAAPAHPQPQARPPGPCGAPCPSARPPNGVLRLRLANAAGSTTQRRSGSITHRLAGAPGASGPPCLPDRPAIAAGCQHIIASARSIGRPNFAEHHARAVRAPPTQARRRRTPLAWPLADAGHGRWQWHLWCRRHARRSALTSANVRSGGLTFARVS